MDKGLRVGIIGCGNISTTYLRLAPLFKGLEMVAVADINVDAANARAAEFDVKAEGIDQLLANNEIDVVVNLTIPDVHYQVTRDIVSAGKHAYSEKPLVLTLEEGISLREIAANNNVQIGCTPDTFLGGSHQQARQIIDDGQIGNITSGTCHVMSMGMESWHPNPDFFFRPGAGPVLDVGPYYVANLINLVGPVKRVTALAGSAQSERTIGNGPREGETVPVLTPTTIHAVLEFQNGAIITLGTSWDVAAHNHGHMELYGTGGSIFLPDPNFFGGDLTVADLNGKREAVAPWEHPFGIVNQGQDDGEPQANYRTAGLADMAVGISEGRPARCSFDVALHGVDVMTSILSSAEEGRAISLQTSCERPAPLDIAAARALLR